MRVSQNKISAVGILFYAKGPGLCDLVRRWIRRPFPPGYIVSAPWFVVPGSIAN